MRIIKTICLFVFTFHFSLFTFSQSDTCHLRISLLTCSPGEELYSAWGHTAIRVTDNVTGTDIVFNYGTFDDSDPDFYANFTKGLMVYALSAYPFSDFVKEYQYYGRGVIEQTLSLSCADKLRLFNALQENARNENRFYNYYFHTDNCTSRARDMIVKSAGNPVAFKSIIPTPPPSYRNLIHVYLDNARQYWNKLGIDILLGANLDKKVTNDQAMFLPDYLMNAFDSASIDNHSLVSSTQTVLSITAPQQKTLDLFRPVVIFSLISLLIFVLSIYNSNRTKKFLAVFDTIFFLVLGLLGVLLVTLWIIRIDDVCRNNYNLLWALPTHLPAAFFITRNKKWVKGYLSFVLLISILLLASWFWIPQQLNVAVIPILVILITRCWRRRY